MGQETMGWRTDSKGWGLLAPRAREMRRGPTEAERRLWQRLRRGGLGLRFRRQAVIGRFIADFYCPAARLIVELDGSSHDARHDIDEQRDVWLQSSGLRVLRVRNDDVLLDLELVDGERLDA